MTIGRLYMQLERENINFRIKRSSIILVNLRSELKSCRYLLKQQHNLAKNLASKTTNLQQEPDCTGLL